MDLDDSNTILFLMDATFSLSYRIWKIPKTVNIFNPSTGLDKSFLLKGKFCQIYSEQKSTLTE